MVHDHPLACQQHAQPPVAEAPAFRRQPAQPIAQNGIVGPPAAVTAVLRSQPMSRQARRWLNP
jgi:hypothetical protein